MIYFFSLLFNPLNLDATFNEEPYPDVLDNSQEDSFIVVKSIRVLAVGYLRNLSIQQLISQSYTLAAPLRNDKVKKEDCYFSMWS